jgi:outer membrane lipoprotein-sorting protein
MVILSMLQNQLRMPPTIVWLTVLVTGAPLTGAETVDVMELLNNVANTYRSAESYHFEACVDTEFSRDGRTTHLSECSRSLAVRPDKARDELIADYGRLISISDGKTTLTYDSAANQYTRTAIGQTRESPTVVPMHGGGLLGTSSQGTLMTEYENLPGRVAAARWLRTEVIRTGGTDVVCHAVSLQLKPYATMPAQVETAVVWIAADSLLIMKDVRTADAALGDRTSRATVTTSFSVARVNVSIPETEFHFTLPDGAKEVGTLKRSTDSSRR